MKDDNKLLLVVIDGQGGGIGRIIIEKLKHEIPEIYVRAVGTNSVATNSMLKGGADDGATGENAIIYNSKKANIIIGVMGILIPNGLLGELTPKMVEAIGISDAVKIMIPMNRCNIKVAVPKITLNEHIAASIELVKEEIERLKK